MSEVKTYPVKDSIKAATHISAEQYNEMYRRSLDDNDAFWAEQAVQHLDWYEKWHTVSRQDFHKAEIAWFEGGKLNLTVNCIDRHLPERASEPKRIGSQRAIGRAPIVKTSRRMPPTPVAAPWYGSTNDGWLCDSIRSAASHPSPRSTTPAFSPGPTTTHGASVGKRPRCARDDL